MGIVESLLQVPTAVELVEIVIIGVVLSVDSFATAAAVGVCANGLGLGQTLRLCLGFAVSHTVMILAGFLLGFTVISLVENYDHWIAFSLLTFVGLKFIYDGLVKKEESCDRGDPTRGMMLVSLCVATSIDALAMGGAFAAMHVGVLISAGVVALCVAVISYAGTEAHHLFGARFGRYAGIAGGIVLLALAAKVLAEHLWL